MELWIYLYSFCDVLWYFEYICIHFSRDMSKYICIHFGCFNEYICIHFGCFNEYICIHFVTFWIYLCSFLSGHPEWSAKQNSRQRIIEGAYSLRWLCKGGLRSFDSATLRSRWQVVVALREPHRMTVKNTVILSGLRSRIRDSE